MSYTNDHHHGTLSPRSISGSTTSTAYSNIPARVLSPHSQKPMLLQGAPDLRVALPHTPHDGHWQSGQQHHMQTSQSYLANSNNRSSWDMYLENSPATAASTSAPQQSLNYQPSRNGAEPAASGDNRTARNQPTQQPSQQAPRS
jgi:hypothetical protein